MQESNYSEPPREMSLLEVIAVFAESWKILVIVPVLVAICAALISLVLPGKYETTALVQVDIDGGRDAIYDSFIAAVAEKPDLAIRVAPDGDTVRKPLVRDLQFTASDDRGRMKISYRNANKADAAAVMAVVIADFSRLMSEREQKSVEEQRRVESLQHTVVVLSQTVTELQAELASKYDLPADQDAYERLVLTLLAVTTDLQSRQAYLATLETAYTRYAVIRPATVPTLVREYSPEGLAGLWGAIAFIATVAFVLVRAAVDNARADPRSRASLQRIAAALRLAKPKQ